MPDTAAEGSRYPALEHLFIFVLLCIMVLYVAKNLFRFSSGGYTLSRPDEEAAETGEQEETVLSDSSEHRD